MAVEDGAALLSRLQLEGKNTRADVVLGLDTNLTAEATATIWSGAPATASFVLSGPEGFQLELQRDCGPAGCDPESLLAVTMPVAAGDYRVQASARAEAAGTASGNWMAQMTLEVTVAIADVTFLPTKYLTGSNVRGQAAMRHE